MTLNRPTAVITGATAGIGAAFATRLAGDGYNVVLVGRNVERLSAKSVEISRAYGVEVEMIAADLSTTEGTAMVEQRVADTDRPVDLVVNNAGKGLKGSFSDNPVEAHEEMLDLNCRSLLRLSHAAAEVMRKRGRGEIINVASVAAHTPSFRPSATYSASKAFVIALTEGIAATNKNTGLHAMALCPGFVSTEFHERAGIGKSKFPSFMWLSPAFVVDAALSDLHKQRVISVPGYFYKAVVTLTKLLPPTFVRKLAILLGRS